MLPFLAERFANPSGSHRFARDARRAVDEARDASPTRSACRPARSCSPAAAPRATTPPSSGRRADGRHRGVRGGRAPRRAARPSSTSAGASSRVDGCGRVDLDDLAAALGPDVAIVSVMAVNNEVGTITDLAAVVRLVRERAPDALLHTDAVQAACWLDLRGDHAARRPDVVERPQVRRAEGRRRAHGARRRAPRADDAWVAVRSASAAAAPTTSPASSPSPRRCASPTPTATVENERLRGLARPARRRHHGAARRRARDRARATPRSPGRRTCASPASRARRCCTCSTRPACAPRRRRRARAARWSRRTCSRRWASTERGRTGALRMTLGHTTTDADVDRGVDVIVDAVATAACGRCSRPRRVEAGRVKVMLAMSGGVDSSVAGARLLDGRPHGRRRHDAAVGW